MGRARVGYGREYYIKNKETIREHGKAYYKENREQICADENYKYATDPAFRQRRSESAAKRRKKITDYITEYKTQHPCIDCGEADPIVLEFDHRDHASKSFGVSTSTGKHKLADIIVEIDKCDVRCANCHRRKTHKDRRDKKFSTAPKKARSLKGAARAVGQSSSRGCEPSAAYVTGPSN